MRAHRAAGTPGVTSGRILEPEVMDDEIDVGAYCDGVATAHLDRLDDTFVAAALSKLARRTPPNRRLRGLDVGTGTGSIPIKMALRRSDLEMIGLDRSAPMLGRARRAARESGVADRVSFRRGDGRRLPFPDRAFDLVVSNSLMHHLPDPAPILDEMARVLRPGGSLFIRDLRRPHPRLIDSHIEKHGRHYRGRMFELFADSVRAAFTEAELRAVVARSRFGAPRRKRRARVRRQFQTYLVVETD